MNILENFPHKSMEIRQKAANLSLVTYFMLCSLIFLFILDLILKTWNVWSIIRNFVILSSSLFIFYFLSKGNFFKAEISSMLYYVGLFVFMLEFTFTHESIHDQGWIFNLTAFVLVGIFLSSIFLHSKNIAIFQFIFIHFMFIFYYFMNISKCEYSSTDMIRQAISIFLLLNISMAFSHLLSRRFHQLYLALKKEQADESAKLTEIIEKFLPICANCKSIRNNDGKWETIENYLNKNEKEIKLTHSICDNCMKKIYKEGHI